MKELSEFIDQEVIDEKVIEQEVIGFLIKMLLGFIDEEFIEIHRRGGY